MEWGVDELPDQHLDKLIEAGAAAVHYEDQLASEKKCGHLGGKVLVPTSQFIRTLNAARIAADVLDVPTLLFARTDALAAALLTSDVDDYDRDFVTGERTAEGFYCVREGIDQAISRALAYAPYADVLWCETSTPDIGEAREFADAVHEKFPGKLLAYNCSPSFNWSKHLDDEQIAGFQQGLADMGYRFQFVTLAGFHALNLSAFELAHEYLRTGMTAYSRLQQREFEMAEKLASNEVARYGLLVHRAAVRFREGIDHGKRARDMRERNHPAEADREIGLALRGEDERGDVLHRVPGDGDDHEPGEGAGDAEGVDRGG